MILKNVLPEDTWEDKYFRTLKQKIPGKTHKGSASRSFLLPAPGTTVRRGSEEGSGTGCNAHQILENSRRASVRSTSSSV